MACNDYSNFSLSETQRSREKRFCKFYNAVVNAFYQNEMKTGEISNLLRRANELSATSKKIVPTESFRCAYLCQLGVHDTCMVIKHFYDFIRTYPAIINKLRNKRNIYICCLESAAALEAVGICTVIDDALKQYGVLDDATANIYISVINKNDDWESISKYVIQKYKETLKKVHLHFRFRAEDLSSKFSGKATEWLNEADVVTMVKCLSSYTNSDKAETVIQKTQKAMKKRAVLFYAANDAKCIKILSKNWLHYSRVYKTIKPKQYRLKDMTVKDLEVIYDHLSLEFAKYDFSPVISSVWIKEKSKKRLKTEVSVTKDGTTKMVPESFKKGRKNNIKLKLVGKFACMDLEKKYKDNSNKLEAKEMSILRHASFDDDY